MNDAVPVSMLHGKGDLPQETDLLGQVRRGGPAPLAHRSPLDELHGDVAHAFGDAGVVNRDDVRMLRQGGGQPGLGEKTLRLGGPGIRGRNLEGDFAAQSGVQGLVDDPVSAPSDLAKELVLAEARPRPEGPGRRRAIPA